MEIDVHIDTSRFVAAMGKFEAGSKRSSEEIAQQQARLFVRDLIKITPPNKGDTAGRKRGTATVRGDLRRLFKPVAKNFDVENLASAHAAARNSRGRVPKKVKQNRVPREAFRAYLAATLARVGLLLSGWKSAARRFGQNLPEWVARHRDRGGVAVDRDARQIKITLTNDVRFAGEVRGIQKRVQSALDNRAEQMNKQVERFAVVQAARAAGFK